MKCPKCGVECTHDQKFCHACGEEVSHAFCGKCGIETPPETPTSHPIDRAVIKIFFILIFIFFIVIIFRNNNIFSLNLTTEKENIFEKITEIKEKIIDNKNYLKIGEYKKYELNDQTTHDIKATAITKSGTTIHKTVNNWLKSNIKNEKDIWILTVNSAKGTRKYLRLNLQKNIDKTIPKEYSETGFPHLYFKQQ